MEAEAAHQAAIARERQAKQDAERQRQIAEWQRAQNEQTAQRIKAATQAEAEALQEHRAEMVQYCPVCSCGEQTWLLSWQRLWWGGQRLTQTCVKCGRLIPPTVSPSPCPNCRMAFSLVLDSEGTLTCHCGQQYLWGEWLTTWKPGQAARLAPGIRFEDLRRHLYVTARQK